MTLLFNLFILGIGVYLFYRIFILPRLENIKLRGELAKAEINIRFLKESIVIRDWCVNYLKIYVALLKNDFRLDFIGSSGFQEMLIKEFELFEKIRSFNPEIELDQEMMKGREIYAYLLMPKNSLPS
ncbi:MAG: hypothetical protein Q8R55_05445 [Candidatus Taylorbacteria bacterium]|nr:hypothetical protein [Candidatus Taylorbacteria bacterium]